MFGPGDLCFIAARLCLPRAAQDALSSILAQAEARARIQIPSVPVRIYAEKNFPIPHSWSSSLLYSDLPTSEELLSAFASPDGAALLSQCSLITTCLNEENTVRAWLDSLLEQHVHPAEVVLCDGGSTDHTLDIVQHWLTERATSGSVPFLLRVTEKTGANIAAGRNAAVEKAQGSVLLLSDLGCKIDPWWTARLLFPFLRNPGLDASMGWYDVQAPSVNDNELVSLLVSNLQRVDPAIFLPSARSLAVRRTTFDMLGGFPEFLSHAGEDSLFDYYLLSCGEQFAFVPQATVCWQFPAGLRKQWITICNYARGDAEGGKLFWRHYIWLLRGALNTAAELALATLCAVLSVLLNSSTSAWLALAFSLFALVRLATLLWHYQLEIPCTTRPWYWFRARLLIASSQAVGFFLGWKNRREIEARRREGRAHILVLSDTPLLRESERSAFRDYIEQQLFQKCIVTIVYARHVPGTLYAHQFLDQHGAQNFDAGAFQEILLRYGVTQPLLVKNFSSHPELERLEAIF